MGTSERVAREVAFHDDRFRGATDRRRTAKFYEADRSFHSRYWSLVDQWGSEAEPILELGCGPDAAVLRDRLSNRERVAIDISEVAVERCRASGSAARFQVMDCHALELPDHSQGLVCGSGILHHLDLAVAVPEIARVLRSGGAGVFLEPLGHNPLINLYRRLTPGLRTADEHPLLLSDLEHLELHFATVEVEYFGLTAPAAGVLTRLPGGHAVARLFRALDERLLRLRWLQRHAWMAVIVVRQADVGA